MEKVGLVGGGRGSVIGRSSSESSSSSETLSSSFLEFERIGEGCAWTRGVERELFALLSSVMQFSR